ncbi:MAG TPA: DNA polymerase/3'-5' exonuclease PolX [Gemmataceae bacterium]|nr:DNA polymerase/3'-5' exonuclease PolX [Gemmataceae bacterium]
MDKHQVAAILDEIGTMLELQGETPFRSNAYHNGARAIEQLEEDLATVVREGRLAAVPGIGSTLRDKITTLVATGSLPFYEDLRKKIPAGLFDILRIQGLGPKRVKLMYDQLGIDTLDKLAAACESGQVAKLKGMGDKTQQKILEGIQSLRQMGSRVRIDQALALASRLIEGLEKAPGIIRMELCGSLRRRRETIKDIDILISSDAPEPIMERFVSLPGVTQVIAHGATKSSVIVQGDGRLFMNADLRIVSDEQFPFALHYFTGSKEHNIAMRQRAQQYGLKLNEYELAGPDRRVNCRDEADVFKALDLAYIPPEMRENTGEMDAAVNGELPNLIEVDDIQGVFHCHTTYSDGGNSVEEMALAAKAIGLKYLGLADHSQSLTIANGLTPERVRQQQAEIDAVNQRLKGFKVLKGTECDILADGRLDYSDDLLATFDYVVASVHSHFKQSREEMTARIIKAIRNPHVTMLGHATGRLLLRREGYPVDLEAVLHAAAESGTMIEINAHPQRLDLDWIHCKRAKALGVKIVINPDAHNAGDIDLYRYGVDVARRGWLEKGDVFNTKSLADVTKALAARKPS